MFQCYANSHNLEVVSYVCFILVYDALTGDIVREFEGHRECVRDVSWHPYRPEITSSSVSFNNINWQRIYFKIINGYSIQNL